MRILLADDQKEIRLLAVDQLERDGHSVVAVSNGQEALAEFERAPFDVLLLDEHMPALSGVDVLHAIRATEAGKRQMVVAVTGYNSEQDRQRLLAEGFDLVIGKPFRLDRLDETLRGLQSSRILPQASGHQTEATHSLAGLLQSVGGDPRLLLRLIRTFLRHTPRRVAEIEFAIRFQRPDKLASAAHALKGSVAMFGAAAARECCQNLQELARRQDLSSAGGLFDLLKEEIAKVEANLRGYAGQITRSGPGNRQKRSAARSEPH